MSENPFKSPKAEAERKLQAPRPRFGLGQLLWLLGTVAAVSSVVASGFGYNLFDLTLIVAASSVAILIGSYLIGRQR
jgi:hypothetical protein